MWRGLASLLAKLAARDKRFVRLLRAEPYPSSGDMGIKFYPNKSFHKEKDAFGRWFTPNKEYIENYPTLSPDSSKLIKSLKVPKEKLKEWDARKTFDYVHPLEKSVIVPKEYMGSAKVDVLRSLPYLSSKNRHNYPVVNKNNLLLRRLFELLKLKAQGKKSGGIVSLML